MRTMPYNTELQDKELEILRNAVEKAEKKRHDAISSPIIKNIFDILETFLKKNGFICYGGTAINNILPTHAQFYNKSIELPDYDFFTPDALNDVKKLADIYYEKGFDEVEAKAGIHIGTYKLFVNFLPIADVTQLDSELYTSLKKHAIVRKGISYAPPNYLRMAAYLELSRPDGDVSRWEKVWKRLALLNKYYPISVKNCSIADFIRKFEAPITNQSTIYDIVKQSIIKQNLIFFGGFAIYSYGRYLSNKDRRKLLNYPDFDVLAKDPEQAAYIIKAALDKANIPDVHIYLHEGVGEIIAPHYEIRVGAESIAFIYKPLACHSYNTINIDNQPVNIASIDTMMSLYLAFLYVDRPHLDPHRIMCICQYLLMVQTRNRFKQRGLLKRFSTTCYGKQQTLETMRAEKAALFNNLKHNTCSDDYKKYFLRYLPSRKDKCQKTRSKKTRSKKTRSKKTRSKKTRSKKTRSKKTRSKK